jgi:hypothetical protein
MTPDVALLNTLSVQAGNGALPSLADVGAAVPAPLAGGIEAQVEPLRAIEDAQSAVTSDPASLEGRIGADLTEQEISDISRRLERGEDPENLFRLIAAQRTRPDFELGSFAGGEAVVSFVGSAGTGQLGIGSPAGGRYLVASEAIDRLRAQIDDLYRTYLGVVEAEFNAFPDFVAPYFGPDNAAANGVHDNSVAGLPALPLRQEKFGVGMLSYLFIRTLLTKMGYQCPKNFFSDKWLKSKQFVLAAPKKGSRTMTLVGSIAAIDKLAVVMQTWLPDDASAPYTPGIVDIGVLDPRLQRNSTTKLSNHTWGNAIDIDATWNPQFGAAVAKIIERRAAPFTFAKATIEREKDVDPVVAQLKGASATLSTWLQAALPEEERLKNEMDDRQKQFDTAVKKVKSFSQKQQGTDAFKQALADEDKALSQLNDARASYEANPDSADISLLRDNLGEPKLKIMQAGGFFDLPGELIKSLVGQGFTWGGAPDAPAGWPATNRDFMHFELPRPTIGDDCKLDN